LDQIRQSQLNLNSSQGLSGQFDAWIVAAVAGDAHAFDELYRLYSQQIYSYCFYRVNNQEDAEDLTAQTFFKAWQAIGRYRPGEAPFLAWLYRIAHNLVVNYYKSRKRHFEIADAGLDEHFVESLEDGGESPLEALFKRGQQEELKRAMAELTEEQQQVLYLRFIEDWSHAQIANYLGKKEGAVRALQFRAVAMLEKILSRERVLEY